MICLENSTRVPAKLAITFFVFLFLWSASCFAVLGGDVASVQVDQIHINAVLRVARAQNYTIHELKSPSGAIVREFTSSSGKVFAVAWQSPVLLDLKQLLGSHFEEFQQAAGQAQNGRLGRGPLIIHHPGLIVEMSGHMRDFAGRAYLPDQLPANVHEEQIR